MSKTTVIYWSGTGNTEAMANAIVEGLGEADLFSVGDTSVADALAYDKLVLGCPSMGDEILEEDEFEPFFTELETQLGDKKVALFGSYDWGDGEWMRNWLARCQEQDINVFPETLIVHETPDAEGEEQCKDFGSKVAAF